MALPPERAEISAPYPNPSNAVARVGFGKMWDWLTGLFGLEGTPAGARLALGLNFGLWSNTTVGITSLTGTITNGNATIRYRIIDKTIFFNIIVTDIANGDGGGLIQCTVPWTFFRESSFAGRESQALGFGVIATAVGSVFTFAKFDGSYPGGSGYRFAVNGVGEIA